MLKIIESILLESPALSLNKKSPIEVVVSLVGVYLTWPSMYVHRSSNDCLEMPVKSGYSSSLREAKSKRFWHFLHAYLSFVTLIQSLHSQMQSYMCWKQLAPLLLWFLRPYVQDNILSHFCFFFACGKKTYSQCEKTKNLELVLFSPFTSDTRYMCVAKK